MERTSSPQLPTAPLGAGAVLADRYRLERFIARGGMADVYEALDQVLDRPVAVKLFRAAEAVDRQRFDAEVVLLAGLNHPNLVAVYDAGEHGGDGFVVLELVDGPTLQQVFAQRGPIPPAEARELGLALAGALDHVHERGIVHRDVTPANVICGPDGGPKLADFGIARLLDTTRVTATAMTVGTAAYMAPEQVQGLDVTPAADVYSLGLLLLHGLTGAPAFRGPSHEVAVARLTRDPHVPDDLPLPWGGLLRSMTARRPEDRPTADEVRLLLRGDAPAAAGAVAAASTVVVPTPDGAAPDAAAATVAMAAAPAASPAPAGGTQVMPAAMVPATDLGRAGPPPRPGPATGPRRWWAVALAAVVLLLLALQGAAGGDWTGELGRARAAALAAHEAQAAASTTTTTVEATTTVAPAPPPAPGAQGDGKGKGKGEGKGRGDDGDGDDD